MFSQSNIYCLDAYFYNYLTQSVVWIPKVLPSLISNLTRLLSGRFSDDRNVRFSYFGDKYHRNNLINNTVCAYNPHDPDTRLCNIFRLGDMVEAAGGNYSTLATTGGVMAIHIQWKCNLDFDFIKNCLPE